MKFTVSQISPEVELVFANADQFINVYPAYHQKSDFRYCNVNISDWEVVSGQYRWKNDFLDINEDTVPTIQLIYSYNATAVDRQQQYAAFKGINAVETTTGRLYLYCKSRPTVNFRIRYRILNKLDLAIPLNRLFGVSLGYSTDVEQLMIELVGYNPVTNQIIPMSTNVPTATKSYAGAMPGGLLARVEKLESLYNATMEQPYAIKGYASDAAATPQTTYYQDIAAVQSVAADTWFKECEIFTTTDPSDFTTAYHMFYQQRATRLNLTHIYTKNVTSFSYALAANSLLQTIVGLDLLDTRNATDLSYMFAEDAVLEKVDLSLLCLDKLENIEGLFKNCSSITEINVSNIDFTYSVGSGPNLINQPDIFTGIPDDCVIWVGGEDQRNAILDKYPNLTGITYN